MPNVTVPDGADPLIHVWTTLAPKLTSAAGGYSSAVYEHSSLSLREFEAARITMARINDCALCLDWRTARDVPSRGADPDEVPESFYAAVGSDDGSLTEREALAAEFARRYAVDHRQHGRGLLGPVPRCLHRRRARRPGAVRRVVAGTRPLQPGVRHRRGLPGPGGARHIGTTGLRRSRWRR